MSSARIYGFAFVALIWVVVFYGMWEGITAVQSSYGIVLFGELCLYGGLAFMITLGVITLRMIYLEGTNGLVGMIKYGKRQSPARITKTKEGDGK